MLENLATQFHNQILVKFKNFRDLRQNCEFGGDILALAAIDVAAALFHFREHILSQHRLSREAVTARCPEFKLIADVTNAVKHGHVTRIPSDGPSLVKSKEDIYELGIIINFKHVDDAYSHSEAVVCVNGTDGQRHCLDDAVVDVVNFWGKELKRLGVRDFKPYEKFPFPGTQLVSRENAKSLTVKAVQGHEFSSKWQFMDYDGSEAFAKPVDLTGADVRMNIYKPNHSLDMHISIPGFDADYVHTIDLTDEESQEFIKLDTDEEREAYHHRIAEMHNEEISDGLSKHCARNPKN